MSEDTKLVRLESFVDKTLAMIIGLPAPFTVIVIVVYTLIAAYVGHVL